MTDNNGLRRRGGGGANHDGEGSGEELPSWAGRRAGTREEALASAGPLHTDDLLQRPRFKPPSSAVDDDDDEYAGEISIAAAAPPPAARVLRKLRDSKNLRFRHLNAARGRAGGGSDVELFGVIVVAIVMLAAYFRHLWLG